jgi:transcription-repair coupling factor (superfamily II helicase)
LLGYERVDQVRERGQFAVRGGIVDVYPSTGDPLRIDFWGDVVDSLRTFSVFSQRTLAAVQQRTLYSAFEVDGSLPEYETALNQVLAAWERQGREEAPDELYRRAGVRALAGLTGRFTSIAELLAGSTTQLAVYGSEDTYRALADFAAEVEQSVSGVGQQGSFSVPLAEIRRLLSGGLQVDLVQRDQNVQCTRYYRRRARAVTSG